MANNRILIGAEALFVGSGLATGLQPSGGHKQLHRVQNFSYDFSIPLENVVQAGDIAPIDQLQVNPTTVNFNSSYLATNVYNESGLGLYVGGDQSALKNILDGSQGDKNYFVRVAPDGNSANGYTGTDGGVYGFGNAVLASYQARGAVGGFPTAEFTLEALNMTFTNTTINIDSPAIDPTTGIPVTGIVTSIPTSSTGLAGQPTALKPGNITVNLNGGGFAMGNVCLQSYNLSFNLNLEPQICLGSDYPANRLIKFPVDCKFSVEAQVKDMGTGNLASLKCGVPAYDMSVTLRKPTCDGTLGAVQAFYSIKGAKLEGQQFSDSQGSNKTVTLNFTTQIGSAQQLTKGLFISGSLV